MSISRRSVVLPALLLVLAACTSKQEKHDKELAAAWQALEDGPVQSAGFEDDVAALEAFLAKFPESHPLGNPHAPDAQARLRAARDVIAEQKAQEERTRALAEKIEKVRPRLAPIVANVLFRFAALSQPQARYADPEPTAVLELESEGVKMVSRGRFALSAWEVGVHRDVVRDVMKDVRKAIGSAVYDEKAKRYDKEALEVLLESAYVSPDTPLLGRTAKDVYPMFRPFVRAQAKLHRFLAGAHADLSAEDREYFSSLASESEDVEDGEDYMPELREVDGPGFWGEAAQYATDWRDKRFFYREITLRWNIDAQARIAREGFDYLDTGFWIRRLDDGTADVLGRFLKRVIADYDPSFLGELESIPSNGFEPDSDAPDGPSDDEAAYEPPEPPSLPVHEGPLAGSRVVSFGWSPHSDRPYAASFDAEGKALTIVTRREIQRRATESGAPRLLRTVATGAMDVRTAAFSKDGRFIAVGIGNPSKSAENGPVSVYVSSSGELVRTFDDLQAFGPVALSEDGSLLAVQGKGGVIDVRSVAAPIASVSTPAEPDATPVPVATPAPAKRPAGTLLAITSDPPALILRKEARVQVHDPFSGAQRGPTHVIAGGSWVTAASASPDGRAVFIAFEDLGVLVGVDPASGAVTRKASFPDVSFGTMLFDPNGDVAALSSDDRVTRIVDVGSGLVRPGAVVGDGGLAFSRDGARLLLRSPPNEAVLYEVPRRVVETSKAP